MKIVVTGGAGFIGSHICDELLNLKHEVVCFDNLSTGKKENIEHHLKNPLFTFIEGDVSNYEQCLKNFKGANAILHQAALGSVPRSIENPLATHNANSTGFLNMLWAAHNSSIKRIVYASSSSVYGDNSDLPKTENNVGIPLSPYAVTKKTNELYANVFSDLYGLEIIGLRYFNVFGERQDPNGAYAAVIPKFVKSVKNNQSPTIHGDGEQMRDFTYVKNVVNANIKALTTTNKEALGTVYNIACGQQTTLNELFNIIKNNFSKVEPSISELKPTHTEPRQGDIKLSYASIDKAKRVLNYKPEMFIEEGLNKLIHSN